MIINDKEALVAILTSPRILSLKLFKYIIINGNVKYIKHKKQVKPTLNTHIFCKIFANKKDICMFIFIIINKNLTYIHIYT